MEEKVREEVNTGMRSLRAVSPVVATALLVLIAVATAVLLYLWVSGTVASQPTEQLTLREQLKIDAADIYFNTTANAFNYTIYVRNVGSVPANITTIYVINANTSEVAYFNSSLNFIVPTGSVKELKGSFTSDKIKPGDTVIIKLVTQRGTEIQYVATVGKKS